MTITIDGKPCTCEKGEILLHIAKRNGITIPTLCHHEGLTGQGCCRVCLVEVEMGGKRSIVTACIYPVERECSVFTNNETVFRQRGMMLSLLRSMAPESAEVIKLCEEYGAPVHERFVKRTGEKCILCGLCVKACESLGTGAISTVNRGVYKKVTTPYDEPSFPCVCCASCATVCPTGAISVEEDDNGRRIWNKTLRLKACKACGAPMGTSFEIQRASKRADAEQPELCEACRKRAIAKVMADAYGR